MADPASSHSAVNMSMGFMTTTTGGEASGEVSDEPVVGFSRRTRQLERAPRPPGGVRPTVDGASARRTAVTVPTADESSRLSTTAFDAQSTHVVDASVHTLARPSPPNPQADSRHCWPSAGLQSHGPGEHEPLRTVEQAPPGNRWVRFAWEPLVGEDGDADSSTVSPPVITGGGVPGINGPAMPPEAVGPSGQGGEQLGVKRSRTPDGHCGFDHQGAEAKRVGTPHRLIRRVPGQREDAKRPLRAFSRYSCTPPVANKVLPATGGETGTVDISVPNSGSRWMRADNRAGLRTPAARLQRREAGGGKAASDTCLKRGGRGVVDASRGEGTLHPQGGKSRGGGARCSAGSRRAPGKTTDWADGAARTRNDSLKVQRLSLGHMDSLTNGVQSLGVVSPGAPGVARAGESVDAGPIPGSVQQLQACGGSADDTVSPAGLRPTSTLEGNRNDAFGDVAAGHVWVGGGGGRQPVVVSGEGDEEGSKLADDSVLALGASFRATTGHLATLSGEPTPADSSRLQSPPLHAVVDAGEEPNPYSRAGRQGLPRVESATSSDTNTSQREDAGPMDVDKAEGGCSFAAATATTNAAEASSAQSTPSELSLAGLSDGGREAPEYDTAVNAAAGCGPDANGDGGDGKTVLTGDGDLDDDSSDGGAAHEEISAWLHSTEDWWIS